MRIFIYSRILKQNDIPTLQELIGLLDEFKIDYIFPRQYWQQIEATKAIEGFHEVVDEEQDLTKKDVDMIITLGGDGTILGCLKWVRDTKIPVLGINLGRMGFLADVEKTKIRFAIESVVAGRYSLDKRSLIRLDSNIPLFGSLPYALNDFTLLKRDTSSMVTIHAYVNGDYLNTYWSDGIIVSTPTGSTGYSLSCGGPVIFPSSNNFVITPVAPHNLNVRPIVIPDDAVVSFEIEGRAENFLCTLDSRFETISSSVKLAVKKANFELSLVQLEEGHFLQTIRDKLTWGMDKRNR
jgi:NAD+ kinase